MCARSLCAGIVLYDTPFLFLNYIIHKVYETHIHIEILSKILQFHISDMKYDKKKSKIEDDFVIEWACQIAQSLVINSDR